MSKIINVGRVTSYADAVAGGYTGTREQWEHDLANLGTVAAEVEADRAEVAENTATVAEDKAAVEEDRSAAESAAESAASSAASAHTDAIAATAAKEAAQTAQGLAENAASTAANAKDAAQTAQGKAEDAQTAAEAAQTAAEDAQTAAAGSATAAASSATAAAESEATAQHIADMYPTDKTLSVVDKAADGKATGDAVADLKSAIDTIDKIVIPEFDLSSQSVIHMNIQPSSGKWARGDNYDTYYFTVPDSAKLLTIKSNATNGTVYALLASTDTHTHGSYPVYATGSGRTFISAGETANINIPSDCKYIWVTKTLSGTSYAPAYLGFNVDLSEVYKIPGMEDLIGDIEKYVPHEVTLAELDDLSSGKYVSDETVSGDNWTTKLVDNASSLYTASAIDVSEYYGDQLVIEIGSNDSHSGVRMFGFCNASNIVSSASKEAALSYVSEGGYLRATRTITNTHFFFSCSSKSHLKISVKTSGEILKKSTIDTRYVSTDGNDANEGTYVAPFATVNKALEWGASCVAIKAGTYYQTIDLSKSSRSSLNIVNADATGKVTLMAPDCIITDSETAVSGYTNVYSAETSKSFHENNIWIFQEGVADENTLISAGKRMPEQRGQAYRCYDTKIVKASAETLADALTEIETSASYKWYKDGTTLYFSRPSAVSSSNPICGSFGTELFSGCARKLSLNISGIDVKYMKFNVVNASNSRIVDCSCMNFFGSGAFVFDGSDGTEIIHCEAARAYSGTNGDGFNAHSSYDGYAFAHQTTAVLINCWSHDNNDDGSSFHERSEFTVIGGLFEQNHFGGGVTPANGSHCTCIGVTARDNGEGGFLYMNATSVAEGGVGGQIKCIDCVSESNNIWESATSAGYKINSAGNKGILINCKAIGEDYGYYVSDNDGALTLIDCGSLNCTNVKGGNTGNITVENTTLVN